jgi:hypothetical protein
MERRRNPGSAPKTSDPIQAGQKIDHCAAAMSRSAIADAPIIGLGIAPAADFDRASGLLALTSSAGGNRRSSAKQIDRAYEREQKLRCHDDPPPVCPLWGSRIGAWTHFAATRQSCGTLNARLLLVIDDDCQRAVKTTSARRMQQSRDRMATEFVWLYGVPAEENESVRRARAFRHLVVAAAHDCACCGLCGGAWCGDRKLGGRQRGGAGGGGSGNHHLP